MEAEMFAYSLLGLGFGGYIFVNGFKWSRQKRRIQNTPTSKIRSIAMGLVEVKGTVSSHESDLLKSPFSNRDCVEYRFTIEEYRRGKKRSHWVTVAQGTDYREFNLTDDTGTVLVNPAKAKLDTKKKGEHGSGFMKDPSQHVLDFLDKRGIRHESFFGLNKRMRYREWYIAPGDQVYIIGTAGDNPYVVDGNSQKNEDDIMIHKGKDFYYISDKKESEVLSSFKWKIIGGLFGGGALIIGCLGFIFFGLGIL